MKKKYWVTLTSEERETREAVISCGQSPASRLAPARMLLKADTGEGHSQ